jgi:exodeoxyribonuclease X
MIWRVFDVETTGFPEDGKATAIIQAGWTDVEMNADGEIFVGLPVNYFCNPFRANPALEMDIGALATHHIQKSDLIDAPAPDEILRKLTAGADFFACHNKEHDGHYFTGAGKPMVCTLKAAQRIWPDAERHSNQFLRYYLGLPVDRDIADPAHWAGPDSYVTAHLLAAILKEGATLDDLIEWSVSATILKTIKFGKHRGTDFKDLPTDYLEWLWKNPSDKADRDLRATLQYHLDRRGALK